MRDQQAVDAISTWIATDLASLRWSFLSRPEGLRYATLLRYWAGLKACATPLCCAT